MKTTLIACNMGDVVAKTGHWITRKYWKMELERCVQCTIHIGAFQYVYMHLLLNEIGEHCMQPITILVWLLDSAFTTGIQFLVLFFAHRAFLFIPFHYWILYWAYILIVMVHLCPKFTIHSPKSNFGHLSMNSFFWGRR